MKDRTQFNLRLTQEELDELMKFVKPGRRSSFIRRAIRSAIKRKIRRMKNDLRH